MARGLFDLSRTRQALLSIAQPGLGALLAQRGIPPVRTVSLGLVAAASGYLAVFSLNDVFDQGSDSEALQAGKGDYEGFDLDTGFLRHPLAAGVLRRRAALIWVGALVTVALVTGWLLNPWCVALFGASVALEAAYCALRKRTWTKTFISGLMVGIGGLAGWVAVGKLTWLAAGFFGFLCAWEIAGRNLPNDLADVRADSAVGLATVATTFGPKTASRAVFAGSTLTFALIPALHLSLADVFASMAVGMVLMLRPSWRLLRIPTPAQAGAYFNRASLLPAVVFAIVLAACLIGGSP